MPTNIAWTDETWNPVHGCSKVSAGCENCYAERISYHQYGHTDQPWTNEHAAENVTEKPEKLDYPSTLDEPKRIFVNSMSDLFHSEVSDEFIREVFAVMRNHPEHVFQILTKRPGRAAHIEIQWPPNVWMGTSVEDGRVLERLDLLRDCDAETLFGSFEPLIGELGEEPDLSGYDWAIVGGESGPDDERREMAHEWVWPIRRACMRQDVAFFFKQSSAHQPEQGQALRCPDGKRREFREMPRLHDAVKRARENRLAADGGLPEWSPATKWGKKADENVDEWGLQDTETLLLAMQEELGELTQAYLESEHEDGDPRDVRIELDDLGALCFQLSWALDNRSVDTVSDQTGGAE